MSNLENTAGRRPVARGVPFGRYVIRRRLGRGGMGEVFLADQLGPLGPVRPVALKRMLPQLAQDERASRMFLEEIGLAATLNHPNIATTYDFGEVDGVYFIAMEYVEGLTLSSIESVLGALPVAEVVAIAGELADALAHAHAEKRPVVHCDISPQNVMISARGTIKLLDFGIAAMEAALAERARGKLSYAAPEQILGSSPDRRFDIWAIGVLTYEALSGKKPSGAELGEYVRLEKLRPELRDISRVIDRALRLDPADRWPSMTSFREALLGAAKVAPASRDKLAALIQRSGGAPSPDEVMEMTGTGVAVVMPGAAATPQKSAATSSETAKTLPSPSPAPPSSSVLTVVAALAGVAVLLAAILNLTGGPESIALPEEPPVKTSPRVVDPPISREEHAKRMREEIERPVEQELARREQETATEDVQHDQPALEAARKTPPKKKARSTEKSSEKSSEKAAVKIGEAAPPVEPVVEANGLGVLSVRTTPWAKVLLDGKNLGEGTVASKPVPAGKHELVLVPGDDRYAPKTVQIEIKVGAATKVIVDFETGVVRVDPS